jgi:hypothetical protein
MSDAIDQIDIAEWLVAAGQMVTSLRRVPPTSDPENAEIRVLRGVLENTADVLEVAIAIIERQPRNRRWDLERRALEGELEGMSSMARGARDHHQRILAKRDARITHLERLGAWLREGRDCVAAHEERTPATVLFRDPRWGILALCPLHAGPLDRLTPDQYIELDP